MQLAPNIFVARIDDRSVVLDLNRDRYIALNANLSDAVESLHLSSVEEGGIPAYERRAIDKLFDHGILTSQRQIKSLRLRKKTTSSQTNHHQVTKSLWAHFSDERASDNPILFTGMTTAMVSLIQVSISLRLRSFKSTIDWIAGTKSRISSDPDRLTCQNLVDAYYEVRPYFPLKPICRLDAPSVCLHLRRNGQQAQLVFGVRLDPFKAHCWVQVGDVAINEPWIHVRQYTPILIV